MSIEQKLEAAEKLAATAKQLFENKAYAKASAADAAAVAAYREIFEALNSLEGDDEHDDNAYGCMHCGTETETLDSDGLCGLCAKDQEEYDNGECPRCGTPSLGSRECYDC